MAMVLAVMRELKVRDPDIHIDLLALTTGIDIAHRQGFTTIGYRDFVDWYDAGTLKKHALPHLAGTQHPLIDTAETTAYLGINLEDLHQQMGAQAAAQAYAAKGRWAFMPLNFMRRLMHQLKPDLVLTTNSPRSEQAAITVAAELGIPSVCMVDLFSPAGDPFLDRTHYADALTTINDLGKKNLVAGGVSAERIHVTGSPAFDGLADPQRQQAALDDRAQLGWQKLKIVLWAGNLEAPPPGLGKASEPAYLAQRVEGILREYVSAHSEVALVIRYHPNQAHHFDASRQQERVLWSQAELRHPHLDIHLADLVIVNGSTIGLEAAIAGKSVLAMDNSHGRHIFPLSDCGVARGVPSYDALAATVHQALEQPFQSEFNQMPGSAAGRVVDVMDSLTKTLHN